MGGFARAFLRPAFVFILVAAVVAFLIVGIGQLLLHLHPEMVEHEVSGSPPLFRSSSGQSSSWPWGSPWWCSSVARSCPGREASRGHSMSRWLSESVPSSLRHTTTDR